MLVTAIGGPTGYGVARCLREVPGIFVLGVDSSASCPTRHAVHAFRVVPRVNEPHYLTVLEELVREYNVDLIYPTLQDELVILHSLSSVTRVAVNPPEITRLLLSKKKIYDRLKKSEFYRLVPRHKLLQAPDELPVFAKALGYPEVPICLKPTSSHGGIGFKVVASEEWIAEQVTRTGRWEGVSLREAIEIVSRLNAWSPLMVMEYLPGEEYSVDVFVGKQDVRLAVPRKRQRTSTGVVIEGITVQNSELMDVSIGIASVLGVQGFYNVQFRYSANEEPKLIDVNPRFCGSQVHSCGAGVNFPLFVLKEALGEQYEVPSPTWGVKMKRYWECTFFVPPLS